MKPLRLPAAVTAAIERLRRQRLSGPQIARRLGLGKLAALEPRPPVIPCQRAGPIGQALDAFSPAECVRYLVHADYVPPHRELLWPKSRCYTAHPPPTMISSRSSKPFFWAAFILNGRRAKTARAVWPRLSGQN